MEHHPSYHAAKRHVERKIGFGIHLAVFLLINGGLLLLNAFLTPQRIWAAWPLLGWGIGLLFHGIGVLFSAPHAAWKQRMIENELKKLQGHTQA